MPACPYALVLCAWAPHWSFSGYLPAARRTSRCHPFDPRHPRRGRQPSERAMRSAYGRQTPPPDYELTCVEAGSPMGELLRRYWQPVCTSDELSDLPKKAKLLGEELVV